MYRAFNREILAYLYWTLKSKLSFIDSLSFDEICMNGRVKNKLNKERFVIK